MGSLKVAMLAAEAHPFSKVGGLADAVAGLARALGEVGVETRVLTPLYPSVRRFPLLKMGPLEFVSAAGEVETAVLWAEAKESPVHYFLAVGDCFERPGVYDDPETGEGYPDNFERFHAFTLAALAMLAQDEWRPDVVHCHDSHVGLAPAYLRLGRGPGGSAFSPRTLFTIHNLAYQGNYPAEKFAQTGFPTELFHGAGPFEFHGQLSLLKAGLSFADVLNTVSPRYAQEIQTREQGWGLEGVLRERAADLFGIVNGIDTNTWDPEADPLIFAPFSARDLPGKARNKERLRELAGLEARDLPLVGMIGRLAEQKGIDLLLAARDELPSLGCQWVVLGSGSPSLERQLAGMAAKHPESFRLFLQFDESLAHQIEAGADIFLMPSRYEPCGLNQMYSMRYGTLPVVRETGGLADTVRDFATYGEKATGFTFRPYRVEAMLAALRQAVEVWREPRLWPILVGNAMAQDFSWQKSAPEYVGLYRRVLAGRPGIR